jgi:group I intron endonuclease
MIIYKTTNLVNGKIYVGQDKNNNPYYYGSGKLLKAAVKKYGQKNFKKEILEECYTLQELNEKEIYWIKTLNSVDKTIGYNISDGSKEGDRKLGQEILRRGRYKYWLEKFGKAEADRRYEEWKIKISQYQQCKIKSGWKHSDDTKKKISESSKGRKCSVETKQKLRKPKPNGFSDKISRIKKGVKLGPSKKRKPILQFDIDGGFIKEWESVTSAELELKIYNINAVCKGKQQTAGGYKWKYKNKENE